MAQNVNWFYIDTTGSVAVRTDTPTTKAVALDWDGLNELLTVASYKNVSVIHLGADIKVRASTPFTKEFTIDGYNPLTPEQNAPYTLTDAGGVYWNSGLYLNFYPIFTGTFVFQNLNIAGSCQYGILGANDYTRGDIVFDNCTGTLPSFSFAQYCNIVLKSNNDLHLSSLCGPTNYTQKEFAKCGGFTVTGPNNKITRNSGGAGPQDAVVWIDTNLGIGAIIKSGAELTVDMQQMDTVRDGANRGCFWVDGANDLTVEKGGVFNFFGASYFMTPDNRFTNIIVNGTFNVLINGVPCKGANTPLFNVYNFTVGRAASVIIASAKLPDTPNYLIYNLYATILYVTGTLTVNEAEQFVLYNGGGGRALLGTGRFELTNTRRLGVSTVARGLSSYSPGYTYSSPARFDRDCFVTGANGFQASTGYGLINAQSTTYGGMLKVSWAPLTFPSDILLNTAVPGQTIVSHIEMDGDYSSDPVINPVYEGDVVITGTGVAGSKISVTLPDHPGSTGPYAATVEANGSWSIVVPTGVTMSGGNTIKATQSQKFETSDGTEYFKGFSDPPVEAVTRFRSMMLEGDNENKIYYAENSAAVQCSVVFASNADEELLPPVITQYLLLAPGSADAAYAAANPNDVVYFNNIYASAAAKLKGVVSINERKGALPLTANAVVWVQGSVVLNGATKTIGAVREFKNLYMTQDIYVHGMVADEPPNTINGLYSRELYPYERIMEGDDTDHPGVYGIPKDYNGEVIEAPTNGYDSVTIRMHDQYKNHWDGVIYGFYDGTINGYNASYEDQIAVPFTIRLDGDFLSSNNQISDANAPKQYHYYTIACSKIEDMWWTDVTVYYREATETENPVTIDLYDYETISVPLDADIDGSPTSKSTNFWDYGAKYNPPADSLYTPTGWFVDSAWDFDKNRDIDNFSDHAKFNPQFTVLSGSGKQNLYITYETGQMLVTERYVKVNDYLSGVWDPATEISVANTKTTSIPYGAENPGYGSAAPVLPGLVPVAYRLIGIDDDTKNILFSYDDHLRDNPETQPTLNQNELVSVLLTGVNLNDAYDASKAVSIVYIYANDSTNSGIPDMEKGRITVNWQGYYLNNAVPAIILQPKTIYLRVDRGYAVNNDMNDPSPIPGGNIDHKIVLPANNPYAGTWVFDQWPNPLDPSEPVTNEPSYTVKISDTKAIGNDPSANTVVDFKYAFATDESYPDKMQYVLEAYHFFDDREDDAEKPVPGANNTIQYLLKGRQYTKIPTAISGYVYVGYRIDDKADIITYAQGYPPATIQFDTPDHNQTVTLLYRRQAMPITVIWEGKTYAESSLLLESVTKNGYIGEKIIVYFDDIALGSQWVLSNPEAFYEIEFSDAAKQRTFTFKEVIPIAVMKVVFASDDGNINFVMTSEKLPTAQQYLQSALNLAGYEIRGYDIYDNYGNLLDEGTGTEATLDPGRGSQTLTFRYRSTTTVIYVRAYGENNEEITASAVQYADAVIGETYSVTAPYIDGYVLAAGETIIKVVNPVAPGVNTVRYNYVPATGNLTIIMQDDDTKEIIGAQSGDYVQDEDIPVPDLKDDYYTAISEPVKYDAALGGKVTYLYQKQTQPVTIRAVDTDTMQPIELTGVVTTKELSGPKGHMFTVTATFVIPGYSLIGSDSQKVYVIPNGSVAVDFLYKKDTTGDVVIRYYYVDKENMEVDLDRVIITAPVGAACEAKLADLSGRGFEPDPSTPNAQKITVAKNDNTISFLYVDKRKTVTVKYYGKSDSAPGGYDLDNVLSTTIEVIAGSDFRYHPVYIDGYVLEKYQIDDLEPVMVQNVEPAPLMARIGGQDPIIIRIDDLADDAVIQLYYQPISKVVELYTVTVTVIGLSGTTELYRYDMRIPQNSGNTDITALRVNGYSVQGAGVETLDIQDSDAAVTFHYDATAGTVLIQLIDQSDNSIITSYTTAAVANSPFTASAPTIKGYQLVSADSVTLPNVAADGSSVITFEYLYACEVIFKAYDGATLGTVYVTWGEQISQGTGTVPVAPERTYYTFIGWYDGAGDLFSTTDINNRVITGDVTFIAQYAPVGDVTISASASPQKAKPGEPLTYTIAVTSIGTTAAENVTLTGGISQDLLNQDYSLDGGSTWQPWTGSLDLGVIESGASVPVLIRGTVNTAITLPVTSTVTVTSSSEDSGSSSRTLTIRTPLFTPRSQAITDLINSVALEEAGLSRILNAEGEKIQAILKIDGVTADQMLKLNKSATKLVNHVAELERVLHEKLSLMNLD